MLDVKVMIPVLLSKRTPMLFEVISVIAPEVLLNSKGIFTFLKKVSWMLNPVVSDVVPSPELAWGT